MVTNYYLVWTCTLMVGNTDTFVLKFRLIWLGILTYFVVPYNYMTVIIDKFVCSLHCYMGNNYNFFPCTDIMGLKTHFVVPLRILMWIMAFWLYIAHMWWGIVTHFIIPCTVMLQTNHNFGCTLPWYDGEWQFFFTLHWISGELLHFNCSLNCYDVY